MAFAVAVADACATWRRGFRLVVLVLLPCLMSSRLQSHMWDPLEEAWEPLAGCTRGCVSRSSAYCNFNFGYNFFLHRPMMETAWLWDGGSCIPSLPWVWMQGCWEYLCQHLYSTKTRSCCVGRCMLYGNAASHEPLKVQDGIVDLIYYSFVLLRNIHHQNLIQVPASCLIFSWEAGHFHLASLGC